MRTSPVGILVVTADGNIVFTNSRAAEIYGLTQDELKTANPDLWRERVSDYEGRPLPDAQQPFVQVMTSGKAIYGFRHAFKRSDGQWTYLSTSGAPVLDDQGRLQEVVFSVEDITPHRIAEEKLRQSFERLQKNLADTVKAMSRVVETRDPYTAGHQERVAQLAGAIAQGMNLSEDHISAVQMAGVIHDIGKLYVPAEILSKPTRLSDIEMELIKVHAQAGYDIVKDIDFPWPIAKIILQHHERLNGSGYPNGVSNGDILPEGSILAVADVVEAMASHRPYRPALGIDKALEEIALNRGVLYEPAVVDVCLKLFREDGFAW
jgi:PAS domain S-box-containing protein/putative nucleotidyltransferase with HDIG domain